MRLLPADQQTFVYCDGAVIAGLHERNGYRHYSLFLDRQLLATCDDLKRVLVDKVDESASLPSRPSDSAGATLI
jgi:hypothetical protein